MINLQEARLFPSKKGVIIDSLSPLVQFLEERGYDLAYKRTNPDAESFIYITAIKKGSGIDILPCDLFDGVSDAESQTREDHNFGVSAYVSRTPQKPSQGMNDTDRKDHNFGELFDKSTYVTKFTKEGKVFYNFNIHLGLNQDHRIEASRLFNAWAQTILNRNPNAYIMGMGDFNAFPDGGGDRQIAELTQPGILEHNSNGLFLKDTNEKVNWSFIAYPYDFVLTDPKTPRFDLDQLKNKSIDEQQETVFEFFNTKCNATCGQLDHVFSRGFQNVHVSLWPTPLHGELSEYNEETVKNYILSHKKNPAFASDHQMLRTVFTY